MNNSSLSTHFNNLSNFLYKHRQLVFLTFACMILFFCPDALSADDWASKLDKEVAQPIVKGLQVLCYPIACGCGLWIVISLWMGNKRLQDMIPWIVACALLVALPSFAKMVQNAAQFY